MYRTITEESISHMVEAFYAKIREDQLLSPIFAAAIGNDWTAHLAKMKAFWSSVLLASRGYKGNPMMAHLRLPRLTERHFEHWLKLWRETAAHSCAEHPAAVFVQRAEMIGERLLQTISMYGETPGLGPVNAR